MSRTSKLTVGVATVWFAVFGWVIFAQEKYTAKVPGGLAFSDFHGQSKTVAFTIPKGASRSHSH
jgi:hypothetical protein